MKAFFAFGAVMLWMVGAPAVGGGVETNAPSLVCKQPTFDFGEMDNRQTIEHTFAIRNVGATPCQVTRLTSVLWDLKTIVTGHGNCCCLGVRASDVVRIWWSSDASREHELEHVKVDNVQWWKLRNDVSLLAPSGPMNCRKAGCYAEVIEIMKMGRWAVEAGDQEAFHCLEAGSSACPEADAARAKADQLYDQAVARRIQCEAM